MSSQARGELSVVLEGERMTAVVLPSRGAKVASLRWRDGDIAVLDEPRCGALPPLDPHRPYAAEDSSGFDDMFPTISAEGALPDHGEAWRLSWSAAREGRALLLEMRSCLLPCILRKRLSIVPWGEGGSALAADYELVNDGARAFEWLWAAHPLMGASPGACLRIEPEPFGEVISTYACPTLPLRLGRYPFPLPRGPEGPRIDAMPEPGGGEGLRAYKYWFSRPLPPGPARVALCDPDIGIVRGLAFDGASTPWLGVWINGGRLMGQRNLAIEPASVPLDCTLSARDAGFPVPLLAPGATARWSISIFAEPRRSAPSGVS